MSRSSFRLGQKIRDPYGRMTYRIEERVGGGGFGEAFRAEQLTKAGHRFPKGHGTVCLKVTTDPASWHREAYFGLLTRGLPNVVQLLGSFPLPVRGGMRYLLIMELKTGGTVQDWIDTKPKPWTAGQVINALCPLARTLDALHASGAMHRDIKPSNVFIGNRKSLYLADFGIARHGLRGRGPVVDALSPAFVATSLLENRHEWLASDDVYQLGLVGLSLLLGELVTGPDADWRTLRHRVSDDGLRQVLHRATGRRVDRYSSAGEFCRDITALREKSRGPIDRHSDFGKVVRRRIR